MRPMIESSLRGNIVYKEDIGDGVCPVKVDLAELELAIVNVAVNFARCDAKWRHIRAIHS